MDKDNRKHNVYPSNLLRVRLSERDFEQNFVPRRFDIRTPPSAKHLSTAECLAWTVSRVEGTPSIYDTVMKPLDLMVQQWHSFSDTKKDESNVKRRTTEEADKAPNERRD